MTPGIELELTTTTRSLPCSSVRLGKDDLLNYQTAFEHSSTAHPDEWHRCCEWVVARMGERAQQLQPQALAQPTAPRV